MATPKTPSRFAAYQATTDIFFSQEIGMIRAGETRTLDSEHPVTKTFVGTGHLIVASTEIPKAETPAS